MSKPSASARRPATQHRDRRRESADGGRVAGQEVAQARGPLEHRMGAHGIEFDDQHPLTQLRQHAGGVPNRVRDASTRLGRGEPHHARAAALPPRAAAVATKTPAATAKAGAQTTINNQLKSATPTETETMTATTMRMETKGGVRQLHSMGMGQTPLKKW